MAGGIKDRSKERRPGILSSILDLSSSFRDPTKIPHGRLKYRTDLLSQLGETLYSNIQGGSGYGRGAMERSLFGIEFDAGDNRYVNAETKMIRGEGVEPTRDYRINIGKRY